MSRGPIYFSVDEAADTASRIAAEMENSGGQVTANAKSSFVKLMKWLIQNRTPFHCTVLMDKWAAKLMPKE